MTVCDVQACFECDQSACFRIDEELWRLPIPFDNITISNQTSIMYRFESCVTWHGTSATMLRAAKTAAADQIFCWISKLAKNKIVVVLLMWLQTIETTKPTKHPKNWNYDNSTFTQFTNNNVLSFCLPSPINAFGSAVTQIRTGAKYKYIFSKMLSFQLCLFVLFIFLPIEFEESSSTRDMPNNSVFQIVDSHRKSKIELMKTTRCRTCHTPAAVAAAVSRSP